MLKANILASFTGTIRESASLLANDFDEILDVAVKDYSRHRPRVGMGNLSLVAGQGVYDAPADLIGFKHHDWGRTNRQRRDQWNSPTVIRIPEVKVVPGENGQKPYRLALDMPPSANALSVCGHTMQFFYTADHQVTDEAAGNLNATTIPAQDRDLLILRMQSEAMLQLSFNRVGKTNVRDPINKMTNRAGLPSVLAADLLALFEKRVSR